MSDSTHKRPRKPRPPKNEAGSSRRPRTPQRRAPSAGDVEAAFQRLEAGEGREVVVAQPVDEPQPSRGPDPTPEEAEEIRLARAGGVTLDVLFTRYPHLHREAVEQLTRNQQAIAAAYAEAERAEGLPDQASDGLIAVTPDGDPSAEPACLPEPAETLEEKADRLEREAIDRALNRSQGKQVDVPQGKVAVVLAKPGPGVGETTIHMDQGDYDRLRAERAKGTTLAELKSTFNLPGQVVRAATAGVKVTPAARPASDEPAPTPAQAQANGAPRKRGRAATHDEAVALARRMAAGETAQALAEETGWAVSTMKTTLRWAKKAGLVTA